ncbi:disease resistance protein RPS2-like [Panicum miliaceum]|uniref:Disease resistance protein RPS2-like n=1 Tax=Panicum miliaceum TaxID=4540 RepID=A0A3L6TIX4_PANMI|nr:disease resistance protein RPS2-like [Panicum miliaceum]
MLEDIAELIEEGNQFKTFASKRLLDLVEERPQILLRDLWESFESTDVSIIRVWGPGGIGKTTLLNNFNNDLKAFDRDYQQSSAQLRTALGCHGMTERKEAQARFLMKALSRKRFVILLDDVWNKFQLEEVGIPTPDFDRKSKLILTSRNVDVCYQTGAQQSLIKMEYLEKEAAWELFRSNLSTQAITTIDSSGPNNVVKEYADAICPKLWWFATSTQGNRECSGRANSTKGMDFGNASNQA